MSWRHSLKVVSKVAETRGYQALLVHGQLGQLLGGKFFNCTAYGPAGQCWGGAVCLLVHVWNAGEQGLMECWLHACRLTVLMTCDWPTQLALRGWPVSASQGQSGSCSGQGSHGKVAG